MGLNADSTDPFKLGDDYITRTQSYCYLGGNVSIKTISHQVKEEVEHRRKHERKFGCFLSANNSAPFYVKRKVWDSSLQSAMLYACETWGNLKPVKQTYTCTVKQLVGVRRQTPNRICLVDLPSHLYSLLF